jgi:hypothetical protein
MGVQCPPKLRGMFWNWMSTNWRNSKTVEEPHNILYLGLWSAGAVIDSVAATAIECYVSTLSNYIAPFLSILSLSLGVLLWSQDEILTSGCPVSTKTMRNFLKLDDYKLNRYPGTILQSGQEAAFTAMAAHAALNQDDSTFGNSRQQTYRNTSVYGMSILKKMN